MFKKPKRRDLSTPREEVLALADLLPSVGFSWKSEIVTTFLTTDCCSDVFRVSNGAVINLCSALIWLNIEEMALRKIIQREDLRKQTMREGCKVRLFSLYFLYRRGVNSKYSLINRNPMKEYSSSTDDKNWQIKMTEEVSFSSKSNAKIFESS